MPLFNVAVREHAYTGRFYSDVVQADSCEDALQVAAQHAAVPRLPSDPEPQQGFDVTVTEQLAAGRFYNEVVQADSCEDALQVAAARAIAFGPLPDPAPQAAVSGRPRCADVWVYALLHCELEAGHDPPHVAVAHRYGRQVRWVRDDLGIARAAPAPATGAPELDP
jgi:hypothetical protein